MLADLSAAHAEALARQLPRAVATVRGVGVPVGALLLAVGAAVLVAGARRRRFIALLGGLLAGALAGAVLSRAAAEGLGLSSRTTISAATALVGVGALAAPPLFPLALGAAAGGVVGYQLPLGFPAATAAGGALALAALAVLGARVLAAGVAGVCGAALALAGLVALAPALPTAPLARHPLVALGTAIVLAVAGAAAQLDAAWGEGGRGDGGVRRRLDGPPEPDDD